MVTSPQSNSISPSRLIQSDIHIPHQIGPFSDFRDRQGFLKNSEKGVEIAQGEEYYNGREIDFLS